MMNAFNCPISSFNSTNIQKYLVLYQIEAVLVPIVDLYKKVNPSTKLQVVKQYFALNEKT